MSWFDQKKNEISESELIAYHLHELPPRREREVAHALERSASLTAISASVEATLHAVKDTPKPIDQAAFTRTWAALQPQLKPYAMPLAIKPRWHTPVLAKAALASLAAAGVFVVATRYSKPARRSAAPATPAALASTQDAPNSSDRPDELSHDREQTSPARPLQLTRTPSGTKLRDRVGIVVASSRLEPAQRLSLHPSTSGEVAIAPPLHESATRSILETEAANTARMIITPNPTPGKIKPHLFKTRSTSHGADIALALGGAFIASHTSVVAGSEQYTQTATPAIGAVGAFHQQLRPHLGYRVTLSYTRPNLEYSYKTSTGGTFGGQINSRIFEAAGTYVIQGPHHGRWSTSADAGAALMAFLPTNDSAASYAYRPAAILGASADYALGKHWAARATYRAQVFRTPNFRYTDGTVPVTVSTVLSNEPSVGIVYRFGKSKPRQPKP